MMKVPYILAVAFLFLSTGCNGQQSRNDQLIELKGRIAAGEYPNIDAIILARDSEILVEEYFNGFDRDRIHDTRSSFKSITGLLAGIAIDQGLFKIDDQIGKIITEWENDPRGNITVKNLLEMKSGLAGEGFFGIGPDCES